MDRKKVVIVGGGFCGAYCAKHLEKHFDVTLFDSKDFFEFTPGIPRTIVEPGHIKKIQVLHRHYLKRAKVVMADVTKVDTEEVTAGGKKYPYDYIVIAAGSRYNLPFKEDHVVMPTRAHDLRDAHNKLEDAQTVAVVGGGLVGVEIAAEIVEHYPDKKVTIIHSHEEIMHRFNSKARKYVHNFLKKHNVDVLIGERVKDVTKKKLVTNKGTEVEADMAFLCTGIKPNALFVKENFPKSFSDRGFTSVNKYLQLKERPNIFVGGDVAGIVEEKTAQNAENHAIVIVDNICRLEKGKELCEYKSKPRPLVVSLGKWKGLFLYKGLTITGLFPGLLKSAIEWAEMRKYRFKK